MFGQGALAALNHLLQGAPWAVARLAPFAGQAVRVTLPPFQFDLGVRADGLLEAIAGPEVRFAVEITLPAETPLLALQSVDAARRAVRIAGSAEFAEALGFVLRNLRWDFEEDLSRFLGDIVAHRVAAGGRSLVGWHRQALRNLTENIVEYLTLEQQPQPSLVRPAEMAGFLATVRNLQQQTELLDRRIARLTQSGR